METAIIILSILAGIILLGCIFMVIVVKYIDGIYKELENLRHLDDEETDDEE